MVNFRRVWAWYSQKQVQKAILEAAQHREVVAVYQAGRFGKRPNVLQYPHDILQAVSQGALAFHGSVERWAEPMRLDVGLGKPELDRLRVGWEILLDVDVKDFELAKLTVRQIIEGLRDHGVSSYGCKFTGGSSFHIGIPFEALPPRINLRPTATQYPHILERLIEYLKWYVRDPLREELLALDTPLGIARRIGKSVDEIMGEEGLEPFKAISMDVFGSRHLFRLPYSLHETSLLVSLPIRVRDIGSFRKEHAVPEKVKVETLFFTRPKLHDAEALVVEALDWTARHRVERPSPPSPRRVRKIRYVSEKWFPPCVTQGILKGLSDGRKRAVFILINFLRNMGWEWKKIEQTLAEWNGRNYSPLRTNYLRTQLRWHMRQERNILPPNCDKPRFYREMGVCQPDELCQGVKNPINYPFRKLRRRRG
jgi:hypothetical protein